MLRIGICEDETDTRAELHTAVSRIMFQYTEMEFVYYEDGKDVIDAVLNGELKLDILFLDINMKNVDGMKTAEFIRKHNVDVDIIFVTVSKDYVFDGYKYKALAYCVKPINQERLNEVLTQYMEEKRTSSDCINVVVEGKKMKLPLDRIIYFESRKRTVIAHTLTNDYSFYAKLNDVWEALKGESFARCHQSYIVNMDMIDSVTNTEIEVAGVRIPISKRYSESINNYQKVK